MNTRKKLEKFVPIFGENVVYHSNLRDYYKIYTCKRYCNDKKSKRLTKKKKPLLLELVKVYRESNKQFGEIIFKSGIIKLACERLIIENKMKRKYIDTNNWRYEGNLSDVFKYMSLTVSNGCKNQKVTELRSYCKGVKDDQLDK